MIAQCYLLLAVCSTNTYISPFFSITVLLNDCRADTHGECLLLTDSVTPNEYYNSQASAMHAALIPVSLDRTPVVDCHILQPRLVLVH
jgi:hypothetical protein